jgi:hypothetical protein
MYPLAVKSTKGNCLRIIRIRKIANPVPPKLYSSRASRPAILLYLHVNRLVRLLIAVLLCS